MQHRIVDRILGTKSLLYKMKKSNNNLHHFRTNSQETIPHVFTECSFTHEFWQKIKQWVQDTVGLSFTFNAKTVLLGLFDKKQLGILFLLAKLYIYISLVNIALLNHTAFLTFFK